MNRVFPMFFMILTDRENGVYPFALRVALNAVGIEALYGVARDIDDTAEAVVLTQQQKEQSTWH